MLIYTNKAIKPAKKIIRKNHQLKQVHSIILVLRALKLSKHLLRPEMDGSLVLRSPGDSLLEALHGG